MRYGIGKAIVISALTGVMFSVSVMAGEQRVQPTYTAEDIAKAKPVATLEVDAEQIRLLLGGASGKGVLNFQGKAYPFTVKAVTAGGVGVTKVHAVGDVYFMKSASDFPGTYSAITAGATVGAGVGASQFQNGKGVLLNLKSKSEGLALSLGIGAVEVKFQ